MSGKNNAVFETAHTPGAVIVPVSQEMTDELIFKLVLELNTKYMAALVDPVQPEHWASDHGSEDEEADAGPHIIFVGGSHAARMAAAAESLGISHRDLSKPGLRITEAAMSDMAAELKEAVENSSQQRTIVIFHLYDNNVYFAAGEDGSRHLPVKVGNRYHVPGRLEYADRAILKNLVNTSACLLRAGGDCCKYILSPLLRYLTMSCCEDPTHITNRAEKKKFIKTMAGRVRDMKDELKDLILGKRIRSFKVLSPNLLLLEGASEQDQAASLNSLWEDDPVHLVPEKYEALVNAILDWLEDESFTNTPVQKLGMANSSNNNNKQRIPSHLQRQSWVGNDDTLAHRDYGSFNSGRARGRSGSRGGHWGGRGGRNRGQHGARGRGAGRGAYKQQYNRPAPY
jgi:hypothetical protein